MNFKQIKFYCKVAKVTLLVELQGEVYVKCFLFDLEHVNDFAGSKTSMLGISQSKIFLKKYFTFCRLVNPSVNFTIVVIQTVELGICTTSNLEKYK